MTAPSTPLAALAASMLTWAWLGDRAITEDGQIDAPSAGLLMPELHDVLNGLQVAIEERDQRITELSASSTGWRAPPLEWRPSFAKLRAAVDGVGQDSTVSFAGGANSAPQQAAGRMAGGDSLFHVNLLRDATIYVWESVSSQIWVWPATETEAATSKVPVLRRVADELEARSPEQVFALLQSAAMFTRGSIEQAAYVGDLVLAGPLSVVRSALQVATDGFFERFPNYKATFGGGSASSFDPLLLPFLLLVLAYVALWEVYGCWRALTYLVRKLCACCLRACRCGRRAPGSNRAPQSVIDENQTEERGDATEAQSPPETPPATPTKLRSPASPAGRTPTLGSPFADGGA